MDEDGSNWVQIVGGLFGVEPSISHDAGKIVFRNGNDQDLWIVNSDGSGLMQLVTHGSGFNLTQPDISEDGSKVVYTAVTVSPPGVTDIFSINTDGSNRINLTNTPSLYEEHPSWSPDGTKIVFTKNPGGGTEIYTMLADGSDITRLTNVSGSDGQASWSPDGNKIAFISNRHWSGVWDIYVMDYDGSNQVNITNNPANDSSPSWSPDSTLIVFASMRQNGSWGDIFRMKADGSEVVQITDSDDSAGEPAW